MRKGRVVAISISTRRGLPKRNVPEARFVEGWGIEGDAHAGKWHRQVSILALESVDKMRSVLPSLRPGAFAENLTTEFLDVPNLEVGDLLLIGEGVLLQITQKGKECHTGCAIYTIVGDCVMPKEGIFARVVRGGRVKVGDEVTVLKGAEVSQP